MSFVVNIGYFDDSRRNKRPHWNNQNPANGVFLYGVEHETEGARMTLDDVQDGISNTLMLSENTLVPNWTWTDSRSVFPNRTSFDTRTVEYIMRNATGKEKVHYGFCWHEPNDLQSEQGRRRRINSKYSTGGTPPFDDAYVAHDYARPSSFHPGGVNVIFCDNHLRFLSDSIDYHVYKQLMTSAHKNSDVRIESDFGYALNDDDY